MKIQKGGATMKRDMYKTVAETTDTISERYDMSLSEWRELTQKAVEGGINGACDAIHIAFVYGYALGRRSAKKSPGTKTGAR